MELSAAVNVLQASPQSELDYSLVCDGYTVGEPSKFAVWASLAYQFSYNNKYICKIIIKWPYHLLTDTAQLQLLVSHLLGKSIMKSERIVDMSGFLSLRGKRAGKLW